MLPIRKYPAGCRTYDVRRLNSEYTMSQQPVPQTTLRYPSLGALRTAHADLLRRRRGEGPSDQLWAEVRAFVAQGRASGAVLDNDNERETAQSLLDYWATLLFQLGGRPGINPPRI